MAKKHTRWHLDEPWGPRIGFKGSINLYEKEHTFIFITSNWNLAFLFFSYEHSYKAWWN